MKSNSPTALNKRGSKVNLDGYTFDSLKEAQFYERFVKHCGYPIEVHPRFTLNELHEIEGGKISSISYSPDFIVFRQKTPTSKRSVGGR